MEHLKTPHTVVLPPHHYPPLDEEHGWEHAAHVVQLPPGYAYPSKPEDYYPHDDASTVYQYHPQFGANEIDDDDASTKDNASAQAPVPPPPEYAHLQDHPP